MNQSTKLLLPSANRSSIPTKIKKRIRFGTNNGHNQVRALIFAFPAFLTMAFCLIEGSDFGRCHQLLDRTEALNITSPKSSFQCSLSNEKCLCTVSSNGSQVSYPNCITRLELQMLRILPLISYVSQLFAIRELFTLGVDCNRALIGVAWVLSSFVIFPIGIGLFGNDCYFFAYTIVSLYSTSGVVAMLFVHDYVQKDKAANNATRLVRSTRKHVARWQEIVWFTENYTSSGQDLFFWSRRASFISSFSIDDMCIFLFFFASYSLTKLIVKKL